MRAFLLPLLIALPLAAQTPADADLAQGRKLFAGHCGVCHGSTGAGGKGPSLQQPTLVHAPDDDTLRRVILNGLPGTEMPGTRMFSPTDLDRVAAYVRSLGRTEIVPLPGNAARGEALYKAKGGCAACHIVSGAGRALGPELTEIGARRSPAYLREALTQPAAAVPPEFLVVSATPNNGASIRGLRITEDTFTLQLRDAAGKFYSFRKSDLTRYEKEFKQSLMPSYEKSLSPAELDDLVAYLATLRGSAK